MQIPGYHSKRRELMQDYMQNVGITKPLFTFSHQNSSSQIWLPRMTRQFFSQSSEQSRRVGEDNTVKDSPRNKSASSPCCWFMPRATLISTRGTSCCLHSAWPYFQFPISMKPEKSNYQDFPTESKNVILNTKKRNYKREYTGKIRR